MAVTQSDLQAFHQFAQVQLDGGAVETLHELVNDWELQRRTEGERTQDIAAVRAALSDMQQGDAGRPAGEISRELRDELADPE